MSSRKPIILGAGGFIGRNLAELLVANGRNPVLVSPYPISGLPCEVTQVTARVSDFETLSEIVEPGCVVFYLINDMTLSNSVKQPSDFVATNLTLFVKFLEWISRIGGVHVVYPSSGGTIYGESEVRPTPETVMPDPQSFYGLMKWTAEKYLKMFASQRSLTYTIARISNPYGPGQVLKYGQGLIPDVIERIGANKPVRIIGGGDAVRDYIHISDVSVCLELCGFDDRTKNQTLNVGTGVGYPVIEVVREIETLMNKNARIESIPSRLGEIQSSILDIRLAKRLVNWQPQFSFQDGLKTLF